MEKEAKDKKQPDALDNGATGATAGEIEPPKSLEEKKKD